MLKIISEESPVSPKGPFEFTLTEQAAKQVLRVMAADKPDAKALRVGVRGGGCSGLQYFMEFTGEPEPKDLVLVQHGVSIYIDPKSQRVLGGTELDFSSGIRSSGFKWNNPNEKKSCGCGESFAV